MRRGTRVVCSLAGTALAAAGVVCLAVSSLAVERPDGFYVVIGSHRLMLPESGMLGDANTYFAEWGLLGLFCLGAATLATLYPRVDDRATRGRVIALLVLALAAAILFAHNVSVL